MEEEERGASSFQNMYVCVCVSVSWTLEWLIYNRHKIYIGEREVRQFGEHGSKCVWFVVVDLQKE